MVLNLVCVGTCIRRGVVLFNTSAPSFKSLMRAVNRLSSLGTDSEMMLEISQLNLLLWIPPSLPLASYALLVNCH